MAITKIDAEGDPRKVCLDYVEKEEPDLAVFATEGRSGLARWLWPSTAQAVARRTRSSALFVPHGCRPMVALEDGKPGGREIRPSPCAWPRRAQQPMSCPFVDRRVHE